MRQLEHYINVGQKRLRCGYTTGTCAAAAAHAAACKLLHGQAPAAVLIETPAGIDAVVEVEELSCGKDWACAGVRKDGGDDPDITDGALVLARVSLADAPGIEVDGGTGVGRVTRAGLDQPIGAAAVNSVPRQMIVKEVLAISRDCDYDGGLRVEISIPAGVELAKRTFNPRLGIEGGLSVLGTSGIVKPMSEDALIASVELELRQRHAEGAADILLCPGNYGYDFARDELALDLKRGVQCSNYLGAALDYACQLGFSSILFVAHIGKMIKVASGVMNTHSRMADARLETMAAHAALCGGSQELIAQVMASVTTDEAIAYLKQAGLLEATMASVMDAVAKHLRHRVGEGLQIEAVTFSKEHGLLGKTQGADRLIALHAT